MLRKKEEFRGNYYTTTFCNFAHRLRDGVPVAHECDVLNPELLQTEAFYGVDEALSDMRDKGKSMSTGRSHRGVEEPEWADEYSWTPRGDRFNIRTEFPWRG